MYQELIEKKNKLAVIGLGYVGLPIALEFSKKTLATRRTVMRISSGFPGSGFPERCRNGRTPSRIPHGPRSSTEAG